MYSYLVPLLVSCELLFIIYILKRKSTSPCMYRHVFSVRCPLGADSLRPDTHPCRSAVTTAGIFRPYKHFLTCQFPRFLYVCVVLMRIFFLCCHSSTNMTFLFVYIQNLSCLFSKRGVNLHQSFSHILMYGCR